MYKNESEWTTTANNVDELQQNNVEQEKPELTEHKPCDSIYIKFKTKQN